jgi:hypothetical protein
MQQRLSPNARAKFAVANHAYRNELYYDPLEGHLHAYSNMRMGKSIIFLQSAGGNFAGMAINRVCAARIQGLFSTARRPSPPTSQGTGLVYRRHGGKRTEGKALAAARNWSTDHRRDVAADLSGTGRHLGISRQRFRRRYLQGTSLTSAEEKGQNFAQTASKI